MVGDPVSLQLIFPGAIQTCEQYNIFPYIYYKTTQVHRTNTGKHNLHFYTKKISINTQNLTYTILVCCVAYKIKVFIYI